MVFIHFHVRVGFPRDFYRFVRVCAASNGEATTHIIFTQKQKEKVLSDVNSTPHLSSIEASFKQLIGCRWK